MMMKLEERASLILLVTGIAVATMEEVILREGVSNLVFPGAVAAYGGPNSVVFATSVGSYTYTPGSPQMENETLFDIASLTKVIATTSAVAKLYEEGYLVLNTPVASILGESFNEANSSKQDITVEHCLLHTAGYPPDPDPWYWSNDFNCPETDETPLPEDFSCLSNIYSSFMNQYIDVNPGIRYEYSDLSFITLQFVIGTVVINNNLISTSQYSEQCYASLLNMKRHKDTNVDIEDSEINEVELSCAYEAFVRTQILQSLLPESEFLPDQSRWDNTAPTLNDTEYTMITPLQGQVGDGDCYAMGGIAGHAGLFSTLPDVSRFAMSWLQQTNISNTNREEEDIDRHLQGYSSPWIPSLSEAIVNETTAKLFTQLHDESMSSRALGWDTNDNSVNDYGFDGVCSQVTSKSTFLHIGYTGTCLCIDPVNGFWSVILTNRVYGCQGQLCPDGSEDAVKDVYRQFNSVAAARFIDRK